MLAEEGLQLASASLRSMSFQSALLFIDARMQ
jgi:hypothetical protein